MRRNLLLCLAFLLLSALSVAAAPWQDRASPEATVRSFLAALERADVTQAAACVQGAKTSGPAIAMLVQEIKKDPVKVTIANVNSTVSGSAATVTGQLTMKSKNSSKP
jgi:hypothetical protein